MVENIGKIGEDVACSFLRDLKYKIIARNYQKPWGEIDIISKDTEGALVFVEVKTLKYRGVDEIRQIISGKFAGLKPEDNLTKSKLAKLKRTCQEFANRNPQLISNQIGWRIDLVTIALPRQQEIDVDKIQLTNIQNSCIIKHYLNLF